MVSTERQANYLLPPMSPQDLSKIAQGETLEQSSPSGTEVLVRARYPETSWSEGGGRSEKAGPVRLGCTSLLTKTRTASRRSKRPSKNFWIFGRSRPGNITGNTQAPFLPARRVQNGIPGAPWNRSRAQQTQTRFHTTSSSSAILRKSPIAFNTSSMCSTLWVGSTSKPWKNMPSMPAASSWRRLEK